MENETKTMDSIISDAQKEGIDFNSSSSESESNKDVNTESPAQVQTKTSEVSKTSGEKSVETAFDESKLPPHLFPQFKDLYAKNRIIEKQLKDKEAILNDPRVARLLAQGKEVVEETPKKESIQVNGQITEEQKAALTQLKSMLGLDQYEQVIENLKKQNQELSQREEDKAFDSEESELEKMSSEFGLDYTSEVYPALTEWLAQNKAYQGLGPGSLKFAFNNVYFSKMGELAERKKNLEMMETQKKLKSGNVESPVKSKEAKGVKTFKSDDDMIASLIKDAGGMDNIDFNA